MLTVEQDERLPVDFRDAFDGMPKDGFLFLSDGALRRQRLSGCGTLGGIQGLGGMDRFACVTSQRLAD